MPRGQNPASRSNLRRGNPGPRKGSVVIANEFRDLARDAALQLLGDLREMALDKTLRPRDRIAAINLFTRYAALDCPEPYLETERRHFQTKYPRLTEADFFASDTAEEQVAQIQTLRHDEDVEIHADFLNALSHRDDPETVRLRELLQSVDPSDLGRDLDRYMRERQAKK